MGFSLELELAKIELSRCENDLRLRRFQLDSLKALASENEDYVSLLEMKQAEHDLEEATLAELKARVILNSLAGK